MDPDSGDPKTCGFGSATLIKTDQNRQNSEHELPAGKYTLYNTLKINLLFPVIKYY
jgi:hypothetical protein